MFELFLQLPVFQGMSHSQLTEIMGKIPFDFRQYLSGELIQESGVVSDGVLSLLQGAVRQTTPAFGRRIFIEQSFSAPYTMPFYSLFGAETRTISSLRAQSQVGAMWVDKPHFLEMLRQNDIMLLNAMNMLSTHAQKQHVAMEYTGMEDSSLRLASWLLAFTDKRAEEILVQASDKDWQDLLHVDAESWQRGLCLLESRGCVERGQGSLKLIDRYDLRSFVREKSAPKW